MCCWQLVHALENGGLALPQDARRYELLWAGEGSSLAGELRRRQLALRPGEPANIQFTSGGAAHGLLNQLGCALWLLPEGGSTFTSKAARNAKQGKAGREGRRL